MKSTTYLLIGGGLASHQAAKLIRMKDASGTIALVGKEARLPYDRPPLSKELLRGEKQPEEIFYEKASWFDDNGVDLHLGVAVDALDIKKKTAVLSGGDSIAFEKALIATGGEPLRMDLPGSDLHGIYYLRTLDDALAIAGEASEGKKAVVIGAGFIGMEVAASLTARGVTVSVVEALPRVWAGFLDKQLSGYVADYCEARGVTFHTNEKITEFRGDRHVTSVVTSSGKELQCDFACVGIGINPETGLARDAGLDTTDGIVVNGLLQTSSPDIFAAGDVASYPDAVFGKRRRVEHWGHAEYSGQVAGLNMTGAKQVYDLLSYAWSDIFDFHIEFAGDERDFDETLVRGRLEDNAFTVLYLKQHRLTAYFAVNTNKREYPRFQKLIRQKIDLSGKANSLRDPSFDLKTLL